MSERWFLRLDGIPGESTDERHRAQIDVHSWSFAVTSESAGSGGGAGSGAGVGRPEFGELLISAPLSIASLKIFLSAASGRHIPEALLSGVHPGEAPRDFLTVKLTGVTVTKSRLGADPRAAAEDQFALDYARIEVTYLPITPTGGAGAPVTAGFDVAHGAVL